MASRWNLKDSKSPQVSGTFLSILADINNVLVWMISTRPLISNSFSPCNNPLVAITSSPIIIGMAVTFIFRKFFKVLVIISLFAFFQFFSL